MLTAEGCAARRERLWAALPGECDLLVVGDPAHLTYFAGYVASPFEFRSAEAGALLLMERDRATLVGDNVIGPFLERAFVDEVVAPVWYEARRSAPHRRGMLVASALDQLRKVPGGRVGIEMAGVPAGVADGLRSARPDATFLDIGPIIRPLRRAKDPDELEALRRSMRAGEAAHAAALRLVVPGMTELDAYRIVQNAAIAELGEPAIVYGDFASGPRTWRDRGGPPTGRAIEPGDLLLLDFSVVVGGYRGDFTNTFAVGAEPAGERRQLFEACLGALRAGEASLRPGIRTRDIDAAVRGPFARIGREGDFGSHSGHGLGLGHPEPPYIVRDSDEVLRVGDVVALEPGLYVEGVGGMRFERNYVITPDGFETLSRHELTLGQA